MTRESPPAALRLTLVLALATAAGCGQLPAESMSSNDPILGGAADTGDDAVMALVHQMGLDGSSACTGTTIAKVGAFGIFLTAAHCVVENDGKGHIVTPLKLATVEELYVIPGPDWLTNVKGGLYFGTTAVAVHPSYDGSVDSRFDLALVRYAGATAQTPVIPAVTAAEDASFSVGAPFTLVGFGKTETSEMNSQRRKVDRVVETLTAQQFQYDQRDLKGACQGDSGGPALVTTPGGARVVGVTSFGDADCTNAGVSVRVAPAASFIQSFVAATPAALSCGECVEAAVAPGNQCVSQGVMCGDMTTACGKFLTCVGACTTAACASACRQSQAAGSAAYEAMVTCQCNGACAAACRTSQACAPYLTAGPATCNDVVDARPACTTCLHGACCAQTAACAADATCTACRQQATSICRSNAAFAALNTCTASCAGAPCGATTTPTPDAGGGAGTGGGGGGTGGGGSGGCGCSVAATPEPGVLAGALAFALAALARRRRR